MGGLLPQHLDLLGILKQWNRRRVYRDAVQQGGDPFSPYGGMQPMRKPVRAREIRTPAQIERQKRLQALREQITSVLVSTTFRQRPRPICNGVN